MKLLFLGQKCTGSKMCRVKNVPGQKCVGSKMCRVKNVRVKNVWVKNVRVKNDLIPTAADDINIKI